jgi:hypothetical protein
VKISNDLHSTPAQVLRSAPEETTVYNMCWKYVNALHLHRSGLLCNVKGRLPLANISWTSFYPAYFWPGFVIRVRTTTDETRTSRPKIPREQTNSNDNSTTYLCAQRRPRGGMNSVPAPIYVMGGSPCFHDPLVISFIQPSCARCHHGFR